MDDASDLNFPSFLVTMEQDKQGKKGQSKLHPQLIKLLVIFAIGVLILFLVINVPALYR